jgi:hypothetical protein
MYVPNAVSIKTAFTKMSTMVKPVPKYANQLKLSGNKSR